MGLQFRRSINLGFFRINFSKRGIGWSIAPIPGFIRFTRTATKNRYWTFSIPGTGLRYQTKSRD
ncbi:MAG: DUF4236 domain-containing protein [Ilumatobacteraceae bacterium]